MQQQQNPLKKAEKQPEKNKLKSVIIWALIIYAVLFVATVSLGFSPLGVTELNNAFFQLFIHDERTSVPADVSLSDTGVLPKETEASSTPAVAPTPTPAASAVPVVSASTDLANGNANNPIRLYIPKVGLDTIIQNPSTNNIVALNNTLLYGPARYPESGDMENSKNVLIFGHSSNLPVVHNQNFKVFNGLKVLTEGDDIILFSGSKGYRYTVRTVRLTSADTEVITFSDDRELILSTCNTLGAKEERYVVTASFSGSFPLATNNS